MAHRTSRRRFLTTTAATGIGYWVAGGLSAKASTSANEKIRFAGIGIGGKGTSDIGDASRHGEVVAVCDIDDNTLNNIGGRYPNAKRYNDFRKMLDEMEGDIDAVTVSTSDHTHAAAAAMAMRRGMHCFCQKPLTRTLYEGRLLGELAREKGLATQMGNQGTATNGLRRNAAMLRAGVVGDLEDIHIWTNRPIWPQGGDRPDPEDVPGHVHWDLWLGPAPYRPYSRGYHPFAWRGWWDFGTGALGDMACHTMNMPFMGLDLTNPISVQAESAGHNRDSFPAWSVIEYEFAATDTRPAVKVTWYDGGRRPSRDLLGVDPAASGSLVIGSKGMLYSPGDNGGAAEFLGGAERIPVEITSSPGHVEEWVEAIKGGPAAVSNFPDYAMALNEMVLLGNLAVWADGEKVDWDSAAMTASGAPDLDVLINTPYREGWSLEL